MKAVVLDEYGGPEVLRLADVDEPSPGAGELQVRVAGAGVNPADCKWRGGLLRMFSELDFPHVLGYDVAGVVCQVGGDVDGFAVGDRVVGMLDHRIKGGYAEYAVLSPLSCAKVPDAMDLALAAAIPTPGLTGLQLIEDAVQPAAGERVLVTGACGSVGRFAVHAALQAGARVIAAVRPVQFDTARSLGASEVLELGAAYDGEAFDHVADAVGGPDVAALCRHVKAGGRIRTVATDPIDPEGLPCKPEFFALHADAGQLALLVSLVAAGEIAFSVAARVPLAQADKAHRLMEAGGQAGKVVLTP